MKKLPDGLLIFGQFGFREIEKSGVHIIGPCPFCGKEHFFVNETSKNKAWDCKVCSREGGYKSFLEQMVEFCDEQFTLKNAKKLLDSRKIDFKTLKNARIGYHPITKNFIIPVFSADGLNINNIKIYDFYKFRNAHGCNAHLYNLHEDRLKNCSSFIVCEGEWDTLAMEEIILKLKLKDVCAIGVPGAGSFRAEAMPLFSGKDVHLLYDNDDAGQKGLQKAINNLSGVARKLTKIVWPENFPKSYDVRDHYNSNENDARKTYEELMSWVEITSSNGDRKTIAESEIVGDGPPVPCKEVYEVFSKWLHIPDLTLIDVIFGTVLANKIPGDPIWMFIVAPSGATKTEPILGLTNCPRIETISTLTPHTLISGANFGGGGDPSLIPRLDKKLLVIKDFTSVLGLPQMEREEIFSILRDAYDGECSKPFGNGITRRYKSTFGILACTTPAIEFATEDHAALGERFLRWRNYIPSNMDSKRKYIVRAIGNVAKEVEMREEIHIISGKVLRAKYDDIPEIPDEIQERIISLAQLISCLRGAVHRDKYTKDITHKSFPELGTRVSKQLFKFLLGVGLFHQVKTIGESEYEIAVRVARSTVPSRLLEALDVVYKKGVPLAALQVSKIIGFNANVTNTILENLCMLDVLTKGVNEKNVRAVYKVRKDIKELIEQSKFIERKKD